jgi:hypothetical protein
VYAFIIVHSFVDAVKLFYSISVTTVKNHEKRFIERQANKLKKIKGKRKIQNIKKLPAV